MSESDTHPTPDDLGPMPEAEIEPGEPNPGGIDAVSQPDGTDEEAEPLTRDLDPDDNPVTGEIPLEVKQTEDTSTEATQESGDEAADEDPGDGGTSSHESPA
ncbi:hypothetical protein [Nocardioides plantarum]|uniref:Sugar ABC transporter ATPase n=1 Tax=Nocardioides plantarum TaxID=29299 RepID=A0ABV5K9D9_9ACTN|nr:hypothetical protein [Nocardioides plantarum]